MTPGFGGFAPPAVAGTTPCEGATPALAAGPPASAAPAFAAPGASIDSVLFLAAAGAKRLAPARIRLVPFIFATAAFTPPGATPAVVTVVFAAVVTVVFAAEKDEEALFPGRMLEFDEEDDEGALPATAAFIAPTFTVTPAFVRAPAFAAAPPLSGDFEGALFSLLWLCSLFFSSNFLLSSMIRAAPTAPDDGEGEDRGDAERGEAGAAGGSTAAAGPAFGAGDVAGALEEEAPAEEGDRPGCWGRGKFSEGGRGSGKCRYVIECVSEQEEVVGQ